MDRSARQATNCRQPGDPAKAAVALLAPTESENPPLRLFLGQDALDLVEQKPGQTKTEIAAGKALSRSTRFSHQQPPRTPIVSASAQANYFCKYAWHSISTAAPLASPLTPDAMRTGRWPALKDFT